jgi:GxxExxY protein
MVFLLDSLCGFCGKIFKRGNRIMRDEKAILELSDRIRQVAFELHAYLRQGYLEKVYENGLAHRLRKAGIKVEQQKSISVYDEDGTILGEYITDLFVEDCLIVELKACRLLVDEHTAQVLGYLRVTHCRDAMLINFGSPRIQIKKLIL